MANPACSEWPKLMSLFNAKTFFFWLIARHGACRPTICEASLGRPNEVESCSKLTNRCELLGTTRRHACHPDSLQFTSGIHMEHGSAYFLSENIPRVCTLGELILFLNSFDAESIASRPFSFPIQGRAKQQKRIILADLL